MTEMNIDLFVKALSDILSEKYGARIKIKAERKGANGREKDVCKNDY